MSLAPHRRRLARLVCLIATLTAAGAQAQDAAERPNVVFIITDDCGFNDFGFQGSPEVKTPHIDALAKQGVRFTNAYVTAPVCGASRAGLITGRYQQRHSFENTPLGNVGIAPEESTLADALKAGGYVSSCVGKWSMGTNDQYHPLNKGFDEFYGFLGMLHPYIPGPVPRGLEMVMTEAPRTGFGIEEVSRRGGMGGLIGGTGPGSAAGKFLRGFEEVSEDGYATDVFTREGIDFIKRNQDKPFFLYLSYNASHSPLQPPQAYVEQYPGLDGKRQLYAATTTALDDSVAQLMAALREMNLEEKTLIVFINDNGGAVDDIAADNSPLSGSKFQMWEGGIRVPMFVVWKDHVPAGKTFDQPVISLDLFPTVLAATGAPRPEKELEGVDLLASLQKGEEDPALADRPLYWRDTNKWAVRKGNWKLTVPQQQVPAPLLFDLSSDVGENHDVAADHPEVVEQLTALWNAWNEQNKPVRGGGGFGGGGGGFGGGGGGGFGGGGARGFGAGAAPQPQRGGPAVDR